MTPRDIYKGVHTLYLLIIWMTNLLSSGALRVRLHVGFEQIQGNATSHDKSFKSPSL
jgi:hypothetical protein